MRRALPLTAVLSALALGRGAFAAIGLPITMTATARPSIIRTHLSRNPHLTATTGANSKARTGPISLCRSYNALDFTVAKYRDFIVKNLNPDARLTYEARGDNWFVISGTKGGDIFYERHLLSHAAQMTEGFVMSYPMALKQTYDPITARMAKSFRSGSGFQTP
jgi:hypothetical protein